MQKSNNLALEFWWLPLTRSAKFSDFLTPPPLSALGNWFILLNSRNLPYFVHFYTAPLPPRSVVKWYNVGLVILIYHIKITDFIMVYQYTIRKPMLNKISNSIPYTNHCKPLGIPLCHFEKHDFVPLSQILNLLVTYPNTNQGPGGYFIIDS